MPSLTRVSALRRTCPLACPSLLPLACGHCIDIAVHQGLRVTCYCCLLHAYCISPPSCSCSTNHIYLGNNGSNSLQGAGQVEQNIILCSRRFPLNAPFAPWISQWFIHPTPQCSKTRMMFEVSRLLLLSQG